MIRASARCGQEIIVSQETYRLFDLIEGQVFNIR